MSLPKATALESVPLFAALGDDERELLARNLDELEIGTGQKLVVEGQGNHTFFVVRSGLVEVSIPGKPAVALGAGSFFGEISMDRQVAATATVTTRTAVKAFVMSRAQFEVVKANERLLLKLRTVMVERLLADRAT